MRNIPGSSSTREKPVQQMDRTFTSSAGDMYWMARPADTPAMGDEDEDEDDDDDEAAGPAAAAADLGAAMVNRRCVVSLCVCSRLLELGKLFVSTCVSLMLKLVKFEQQARDSRHAQCPRKGQKRATLLSAFF